jgi:pimeloyl-ACP methyl ester carboxylesterase
MGCLAAFSCLAQNGIDTSSHKVQFVAVDSNVRLEVLDWGGSGRPVVLLAGAGDTAHAFDMFAPKLAAEYHVYGITRRGVGASSATQTGYEADQLGDNVIAVLDSLGLDRPVLIGHSFAGEELSSLGVRHPARVAGLIYLDAAYSYAYYNTARGKFFDDPRYYVDLAQLRNKLSMLLEGDGGYWQGENKQLLHELLSTDLPEFEKDLRDKERELDLESRLRSRASSALSPKAAAQPAPKGRDVALMAGMKKYSELRVPILAIYALPLAFSPPLSQDPAALAVAQAREAFREDQARAFEKAAPQARVVRLPHALHAVWRSNEADVLREIHTFIAGLR